ncbi:XRE family transcriptional regulator [Lactobacillus gallinarum]|uniref:XRE family transcriptional regulator n=1 Tax=Lactobacillus gallinarum TaxID=52242 RepID=UPI00248DDF1C|nr:XRE family transcriptional regulator [Lactobacillus gallinarum]
MTIGEALKEEREKRGISKYKFSKGIIDRKFYGEVEDKNKNIGSEALVRLLFKHEIDIVNFFSKLETTYAPSNFKVLKNINRKMDIALKESNLSVAKECSDEILKIEGQSILWLRSQVAIASMEGKINSLPKMVIKKIDQELGKYENISTNFEAIRLFANTMMVMDINRVDYFMKIILSKVNKRKLTTIEEERIARLCDNFINLCKEKKYNSDNIEKSFNYLMSLKDIHFLIYKMVGKFNYAVLSENYEKANLIKRELKKLGYEEIAESLQI